MREAGERKKRLTVGFQVFFEGFYEADLWRGVLDVLEENDCNYLLLSGSLPDNRKHFTFQSALTGDLIQPGNLDALILSTSTLKIYLPDNRLQDLYRSFLPLPVISIGISLPGVPGILVDNRQGIQQAVNHLIKVHQCRNIAFIRGPHNNDEAEDRYSAYQDTLRENGLQFDPGLIGEGQFTKESGKKAMAELLNHKNTHFDSILAANDDMALGALEVLMEKGIKVPEEVKLIGFDNTDRARFAPIPITSVEQPVRDLGRKAAAMAIEGANGPELPASVLFPTKLVCRDSCGCISDSIQLIHSQWDENKASNGSKDSHHALFPKVALHYEKFYRKPLRPGFEGPLARFQESAFDRNKHSTYLLELKSILQQEMQQKLDIQDWNNVFSLIHNEYMASREDMEHFDLAELLIQKVRVMIGEMLLLGQANQKITFVDDVFLLRNAMHDFSTTLYIDELMERMVANLPQLGVSSCYVVFYEEPVIVEDLLNWKMPEKGELIMAYNNAGNLLENRTKIVFNTRELLPAGVITADKAYKLLVKPLYFNVEQFGYILFEISVRNEIIYETLCVQISSMIKASLLYAEQAKAEKKSLEANRKLIELDKAKTNFFSNISHELRTPLTLILGPIESIIAGYYGNNLPRNHDIYHTIHSNSLRLLKLINSLLDFSKIEAGKMNVKLQKTNITDLVTFYISAIKSAADSRKINLTFQPSAVDLVVWIDRDLFEKAFFNLLSNALKFTQSGGSIKVGLDLKGPFFALSVQDSGIGIPREKQDFIFERFSQLDDSTTRKYEGSGIGLALTKEIAELHGGSIHVVSKMGIGSTFTIEFPVGSGIDNSLSPDSEDFQDVRSFLLSDIVPEDVFKPEKEPVQSPTRHTVLIIDDKQDMRQYLKTLLSSEYHISLAGNGKEGLEKAGQEKPDIILSDVMMPEMNGYEMTKSLKANELTRGIPIILLTAKADISMKIQGLETGADDYLSKPFNPRELLARIRSNLEMKKLRDILSLKKEALEELVREQTEIIEEEKNHAQELQKKAERQLEEFLLVLASAIESKDEYTRGHVERVARYSRDLAIKIGLPAHEVTSVYMGAIVHDVGKIGIRDSVLNKPASLDTDERSHMQMHTEIGRNILSKIEDISTAVDIAFCHQEKWDGTGYPQGLKGDQIPLPARIVTIADYWDSIITDRPYREALPLPKAIELMNKERGKTFDPVLFDIFMGEDKFYLHYIEPIKLKELD